MEKRFEQILDIALRKKTTDIHFTIFDNECSIQIRTINGLEKIPPETDDIKLFNFLQYQAHLNIAGMNRPQSGSFSYFHNDKFLDFRFSVVTTLRLKNGVLRILSGSGKLSLADLTTELDIQKQLSEWFKMRSGLVLFTGLTGSGKTTTIYSLLNMIKGKTIYSLEDPIEIQHDNMIQLEINEQIGFGYNEGIKQILRHNPDIIMIGEIRDEIAAKMCIRAALTGCLVVSSLHASSTISAIHRLLELGISKGELKACLVGISNQRLLKVYQQDRYTCIYDILDQQAIDEYFSNPDEKYVKMDQKVQLAIKKHEIEPVI